MGPAKRLYFSGVSSLGIDWLKRKSPLELLIPFHHLVSDEPVPHIEKLYAFKNTRQFEADLDWLLRNFRPTTLPEIAQALQQQPDASYDPAAASRPGSPDPTRPDFPETSSSSSSSANTARSGRPASSHSSSRRPLFAEKRFLLTFDDGLRQVYEVAAPILLRKGIAAALFVNPAFVDNKHLFYDLKKGLILDKLATAPPSSGSPSPSGSPAYGSSVSGSSVSGSNPSSGPSSSPDLSKPAALKHILTESAALFGLPGNRPFHSITELETAVRNINYLNQSLTDPLGALLELDFDAYLREKRPFMTREEIASLASQGFDIGAHSIDHPLYSLVSPEEQLRQTLDSVNWVEKTFHPPYRSFAFPHVDTGVGHAFFKELTSPAAAFSDSLPGPVPAAPLDLIFGNSTGMREQHPRVFHRFIGENPALPIEKMAKAVLAYSAFRQKLGKPFVTRP